MQATDPALLHTAPSNDHRQSSQTKQSDNEDEWEYEYDEDETEDFYFTLDLTTHVPDALVKTSSMSNNGKQTKGILDLRLREYKRMSRPSSPSLLDAGSNLQTPGPADESGEESAALTRPNAEQTGTPRQDDEQGDAALISAEASAPTNTLQLIGLHTKSPYLIFNNKFYTTYWLTDLGTQIWISRSGVTEAPTWSGHVLDVVGSSQVRLLARPAKLQPKYDDNAATTPKMTATDTASSTLQNRNDLTGDNPWTQKLAIPRFSTADPAVRAQADFMERLSALKLQKGEHDQIPLYSVKSYEYPSNAAEIREQSWAAIEREQAASSTNGKTSVSASRPASSSLPIQRPRRATNTQQQISRLENVHAAAARGEEDVEDIGEGPSNSNGRAGSEVFLAADGSVSKETRGRTKRSAKLAGLGLSIQDAGEQQTSPKPKRTRRTKAQMEELRRAQAAAKIAQEQA